MADEDKRHSERHAVTFPVICDDGGTYIDGRVLNVSVGGCFVHTRKLLPLGTEVTVSPVGEGVDEACEWQAKVVRVVESQTRENPAGMALQFTRMKRSAFEGLQIMFTTMPKTTVASITEVPAELGVDDDTLQRARIRIRGRRR